jgi:hypothetical protein
MSPAGDRGRGSEPQVSTEVCAAAEELVRAVRAHADSANAADQDGALAARAAIISARHEYSFAVDEAWEQVQPFPLPQTLREREGSPEPRLRQITLQVTYHLQVLAKDRLIDLANEEGCGPASNPAEAVAALYRPWEPSEASGLMTPGASYGGGFRSPRPH